MTQNEKIKLLKKEISELYKKQFGEEIKQKFNSEEEAIEYTKKQDKEIQKYIEQRKKELGINTK